MGNPARLCTESIPILPSAARLIRAWRICGVAVFFWMLIAAAPGAHGQSARDASVQVTAVCEVSPLQITLQWLPSGYNVSLQKVYRRVKGATTWVSVGTPANGATSFVDTAVELGKSYEYFVYRTFTNGPGSAAGYVNAGIRVPLADRHGRVLLLVDDTMAAPLAAELAQFQQDLTGDGWTVIRENVSRTAVPPAIRALIQARYAEDPANTKSLILFGHVPVPYSGNFGPDGHSDHQGAWPADGYYADVDGAWTDSTVNQTSASRAENRNVPGDGKFDQTVLPGVELETGRIDLAAMPAASVSETELLRRYLNRNHAFRFKTGAYAAVPRRGLIDDHFGYFSGEAFAANGWRNFTSFFGSGAGQVVAGDWFGTLQTSKYLCAFGCGPGSYESAGGIGSTSDFATLPSMAVFNVLLGSYFGDWDSTNNFLRAPLAGPPASLGLVSIWAGRPHWHLYHMALGETAGYGAKLTQNNTGQFDSGYVVNNNANRVHIALMGDPTLRLHPVLPPSSLAAATGPSQVTLSWNASPDTDIQGYVVSRAATAAGPFFHVKNDLVTGLTLTDQTAAPGQSYVYMVRGVKLETSASGSYFNASQGVFASGTAGLAPAGPEIAVSGNGNPVANGETATDAANGTDFGATEFGVPKNGQFTVRNTGGTPLNLTGSPTVQITGAHAADFTLAQPPAAQVAPSATTTFEIAFRPAGAGIRSAWVTIASNDPRMPSFQFAITGTGVEPPPAISVTPGTASLALQPGANATHPITITNSGAGTLTHEISTSFSRYSARDSDSFGGPDYAWVDIAATGNEVTGFPDLDDSLSAPIPMGFAFPFYGGAFGSLRICTNGFVSFTDTSITGGNTGLPNVGAPANLVAGFWDDLLMDGTSRIFTKNVNGTFVILFQNMAFFADLTGRRVTFEMLFKPTGEILLQYQSLDPAEADYTIGIQNGDRIEGLLVTDSEVYVHAGMAIRITPPGQPSWIEVNAASGTVPPQSSDDVTATLDAAGLGEGRYYAELEVASNDPAAPMKTVAFELTVGGPDASVYGNGIAIANGESSTAALPGTDFGWVAAGGGSVLREFTIRNFGIEELLVGNVMLSGAGFSLASPPAGAVAPSGMTSFVVRFSPTVAGIVGGSVSFASNDPNKDPYTFAISGVGLTAVELWRALHFGNYVNAGDGADGEDPDHDGVKNVLERAFGGDPKVADRQKLPALVPGATGFLKIRYTRDASLTDLNYIVEATAGFAGWSPIAASTAGAPTVASGARSVVETGSGPVKTVTVEDPVSTALNGTRFLRVRIVRP